MAEAFSFGLVAGGVPDAAAWLGTARRAEAAGFDLLLAPDSQHTPSPFPALAAAAAATTTLRLGTWVLAPLRTPAAVVRETAALQLLSGARFELGLGAGRPDAEGEAAALGAPWGSAGERIARLLDTVAAVRAADPAVPVLIAAGGPRLLADAGRVADAVALAVSPLAPLADVAAAADRARTHGDPAIWCSIAAVAGRPVGYLARQGVDADRLAGAPAALTGDAAAMAAQLSALRDATGVRGVAVPAELAEAFAPVIPLLR